MFLQQKAHMSEICKLPKNLYAWSIKSLQTYIHKYHISLIQGWCLFLWKAHGDQRWLDKIRMSNIVMTARCCQYYVQPPSPVVNSGNKPYNTNMISSSKCLTRLSNTCHTCPVLGHQSTLYRWFMCSQALLIHCLDMQSATTLLFFPIGIWTTPSPNFASRIPSVCWCMSPRMCMDGTLPGTLSETTGTTSVKR